jgi:hypothetical protein
MADDDRRTAAGVHVAQVGRGGAGTLEGVQLAVGRQPRQSERVVAAALRFHGNPP